MKKVGIIDKKSLVDNPTTRVPICLCLDISGSMKRIIGGKYKKTGKTIKRDGKEWDLAEGGITLMSKLKEGYEAFCSAIKNDPIARYSADVAVIVFGDTAKILQNFKTLDDTQVSLNLKPSGETAMAEAVNMALDMLENRKEQYKDCGIDYWQPWLVLMTDGKPQDPRDPKGIELKRAITRTVSLVKNKKLTIFPIGVWEDADMKVLKKFSPAKTPLKLKGSNFKEFFVWLSKSVNQISNSSLGADVKLDLEGIKEWAEIT